MKRIRKLIVATPLVFLLAVAISLVGIGSKSASAAVLDYSSAVNEINSRCNLGYTIAHASYGSNPRLDLNTGVVTYDFNVLCKRCNDNYSGEYAVTGYINNACPAVGKYHYNNYVETHDCIKYTDRHGEGRRFGECGSYRCVYRGFNENIRKGGFSGPPNDGNIYSQYIASRTVVVPNWSVVGRSSGSTDVYLDNICGAHYSSTTRWETIYCSDSFVRVSWTVYNYNLTPSITSPARETVIESDIGAVTVSGRVTNAGPTDSRDTAWQLTELVYTPGTAVSDLPNTNGGTSGSDPCGYFSSTAGCSVLASGTRVYETSGAAHTAPSTISSYGLGTKVCYALSVRPYDQSTGDWRHSALACYVIGKKPKVQILGSDLWVGRGTATATARVVASRTQVGDTHYGSWSEYGIVTPTRITGMASAAGYSGGTTQGNYCSLSLLTFANTLSSGSCDSSTVGGYAIAASSPALSLMGTLATRATANISGARDIASLAADMVYSATGNVTLTSSATIPKGKWVVISAPGRTVTIASNIIYQDTVTKDTDESSRALLSALPQVVIIAHNIVVNEPVTQVDAWLVATDAIRTCSIATVADLGGDVCTTRLTVNGPVITDRLLLYRTAGAGTGAAAGDPAEVFNLRPDAYLWATALQNETARVKTVEFKELPPRY